MSACTPTYPHPLPLHHFLLDYFSEIKNKIYKPFPYSSRSLKVTLKNECWHCFWLYNHIDTLCLYKYFEVMGTSLFFGRSGIRLFPSRVKVSNHPKYGIHSRKSRTWGELVPVFIFSTSFNKSFNFCGTVRFVLGSGYTSGSCIKGEPPDLISQFDLECNA